MLSLTSLVMGLLLPLLVCDDSIECCEVAPMECRECRELREAAPRECRDEPKECRGKPLKSSRKCPRPPIREFGASPDDDVRELLVSKAAIVIYFSL